MIIQIDSGFRDYQKYPFNSEMTININGQPKLENDVRSTNLTENFDKVIQWVGNSSNNNPYQKFRMILF